MRSPLRTSLTCLALLAAGPARGVDLSVGALLGYQDGFGFRAVGNAAELVRDVPIGVSLGIGYTVMDPGDPAAARSVFINDATDGTPEESGHAWDLRLDVIYFLRLKGVEQFGVFLGPRFSMFSGRFRYVGGNEDFTITADDWGVGTGVRGTIPFSRHWGLALSAGFDWYPSSTLYGHDTTYSSGGTIVNGRNNYTWTTADAAVHQPRFVPSILVGVNWRP
jgi:hypothetical protein